YVYAPDPGLFEPLVELGDEVTAGTPAAFIHPHDTPWRAPAIAAFGRAGTVICKRVPGRVERGDCLFHLAADFEASAAGFALADCWHDVFGTGAGGPSIA